MVLAGRVGCERSRCGVDVLVLPAVPQRADQFRCGDAVGVVCNQTQKQRAILSQVVASELARQLRLANSCRGLYPLTHLKMVLDESNTIGVHHSTAQPQQKTEAARHRHEDHPEPEEHEDLLVVCVDWEHALDGVRLHVAKVLTANSHVTQRHSRESDVALILRPVTARRLSVSNVPTARTTTNNVYTHPRSPHAQLPWGPEGLLVPQLLVVMNCKKMQYCINKHNHNRYLFSKFSKIRATRWLFGIQIVGLLNKFNFGQAPDPTPLGELTMLPQTP